MRIFTAPQNILEEWLKDENVDDLKDLNLHVKDLKSLEFLEKRYNRMNNLKYTIDPLQSIPNSNLVIALYITNCACVQLNGKVNKVAYEPLFSYTGSVPVTVVVPV